MKRSRKPLQKAAAASSPTRSHDEGLDLARRLRAFPREAPHVALGQQPVAQSHASHQQRRTATVDEAAALGADEAIEGDLGVPGHLSPDMVKPWTMWRCSRTKTMRMGMTMSDAPASCRGGLTVSCWFSSESPTDRV